MKYLSTILFIFIINTSFSQTTQNLKVMSEDFPPYNFSFNDVPTGFATEVFDLILKKENSSIKSIKVNFLPWAQSYQALQSEKNTMLFVVTRNKTREKMFKWVGPISTAKNGLIGSINKKVENLKDKFVCSVFEDAGGQMFLEKYPAFKNQLIVVQFPDQCLYMLNAGRVDFFAYDINVFKFLAKKLNIDQNQFQMKETFAQANHYYAFHIKTDDSLTSRWQKNLDEIKNTSAFQDLIKKYQLDE